MAGTDRRAALRRQQEADEKARRVRRLTIAGGVTVAIAVVVIVVLAVAQSLRGSAPTAEQQTPPSATQDHGIAVGGKAPVEGTPHLVVWGDYLCPGCAYYHEQLGPAVSRLVADGSITAEVRQAYFKDGGREFGPSKRAAMAAAAADAVGRYDAYHAALFENQRSSYPDALLRDELPAKVGITGADLERFQQLFDGRAFDAWTTEAHEAFMSSGIGGTPSYMVGGTMLEFSDPTTGEILISPTAEGLLEAIRAIA